MSNNSYGGLIWTNHALSRLKERQFNKELVIACYNNPDNTKSGKTPGSVEYQKQFGNKSVTLIVTKNERNEKIVVSAWIDPPVHGTKDHYKRERYLDYQHSSGLRKIWLIIKEQLGF